MPRRDDTQWKVWLCSLLLLFSALTGCDGDPGQDQPDTDAQADIDDELDQDIEPDWIPIEIPGTIPTAAEWITHLNEELLPYWLVGGALGQPEGNFPTFRCDDGSVYHETTNACPELDDADPWIRDHVSRQFVRMMSRQTFMYGAAYHLTGDERLFELHQAGVRTLLERAFDPAGGAYSWFEADGTPAPTIVQRTSQDLAYANLGLAMNYYLTRDPDVLDTIVDLKEYIFDKFWDEDIDMLRWTQLNPNNEAELVAQLDQVNAYLLLLSRILPADVTDSWNEDLFEVVDLMVEDFYSIRNNLFWGAVTTPAAMTVGSFHTDFGHTIKTFWMVYLAGRLFGREDLESFAAEAAPRVFEVAYQPDPGPYEGTWAEKLTGASETAVSPGTEWWSYIELDQMAATLSIEQPEMLDYLATTYPRFFDRMVDPEYGGVYHYVANEDEVRFAKAHLWKNGFHEVEHVVIGYLTGQAIRHEEAELYFAFGDDAVNELAVPYYYEGTESDRTVEPFEEITGFTRTRVTFQDLH